MKWTYIILPLLLYCASEEIDVKSKETSIEDTSYEIKFSPCVCKRQDMIVQAKKTIMSQGIKDYEEITSKDIEPELEDKIIAGEYEHFLYDFSLDDKPKIDSNETISAEGKIKQQELNQFVEKNSKANRRKSEKSSSDYGSKGLEVIKGFQSDRKKRQTVSEIGKSKNSTIILYEIKRK